MDQDSKQPRSKSYEGLLSKAFGISVVINSLMAVLGTLGNIKTLSALGVISDGLAAPTAHLFGSVIAPKEHSFGAIAIAGVEGIVISLALYTVVAWLVLRLWPRSRS